MIQFGVLMYAVAVASLAGLASANIPPHLYKQLANVTSTEEFLQRFVHPAPPSERTAQGREVEGLLYENAETASVSTSGMAAIKNMLAEEDHCSPRNVTVQVPEDPDPNVVFWPTCTRMEQCGGCCGHEMLECAPTEKRAVTKKFLKTRYPTYKSNGFVVDGWQSIVFEQHLACKCRCRIQEHHCNLNLQTYIPGACRCQCKNEKEALTCKSSQIWDDKMCACRCIRRLHCLQDEYFDDTTCSCRVKSVDLLEGGGKTPSTAAPRPADPCQALVCRTGYTKERMGSRCKCVIPHFLPDPFSLPGGGGRHDEGGPAGRPLYPEIAEVPHEDPNHWHRYPAIEAPGPARHRERPGYPEPVLPGGRVRSVRGNRRVDSVNSLRRLYHDERDD